MNRSRKYSLIKHTVFSQEYQRLELAQLSALDKDGKEDAKKKEKSLKSAVNSTEKIRTWVEHTLEKSKLEEHLETIISKPEGKGPGY